MSRVASPPARSASRFLARVLLGAKPARIVLSERDTMRVLELLENPPKPTAALRAAARSHREQTGG
jgi:uncharacterized protein (DUF1778 family)